MQHCTGRKMPGEIKSVADLNRTERAHKNTRQIFSDLHANLQGDRFEFPVYFFLCLSCRFSQEKRPMIRLVLIIIQTALPVMPGQYGMHTVPVFWASGLVVPPVKSGFLYGFRHVSLSVKQVYRPIAPAADLRVTPSGRLKNTNPVTCAAG